MGLALCVCGGPRVNVAGLGCGCLGVGFESGCLGAAVCGRDYVAWPCVWAWLCGGVAVWVCGRGYVGVGVMAHHVGVPVRGCGCLGVNIWACPCEGVAVRGSGCVRAWL